MSKAARAGSPARGGGRRSPTSSPSALILARFAPGERVELTGFFNLVLVYNKGAAFSFLADAPGWQTPVLVGLRRWSRRWSCRVLLVRIARAAAVLRRPRADPRRRARQRHRPPALRPRGRLPRVARRRLALPGVQRRRLGDHDRRGASDPRRLPPAMKSELALLLKALAFAAHKHRDQRRKDAAGLALHQPSDRARRRAGERGRGDRLSKCSARRCCTTPSRTPRPRTEELVDAFGSRIARHRRRSDRRQDAAEARAQAPADRARARTLSGEAKLVKLADKICNLRDVAERPPANWDLARRREYFDWAKRVVDGLRGADPRLEAAFDAAYAQRPA